MFSLVWPQSRPRRASRASFAGRASEGSSLICVFYFRKELKRIENTIRKRNVTCKCENDTKRNVSERNRKETPHFNISRKRIDLLVAVCLYCLFALGATEGIYTYPLLKWWGAFLVRKPLIGFTLVAHAWSKGPTTQMFSWWNKMEAPVSGVGCSSLLTTSTKTRAVPRQEENS